MTKWLRTEAPDSVFEEAYSRDL